MEDINKKIALLEYKQIGLKSNCNRINSSHSEIIENAQKKFEYIKNKNDTHKLTEHVISLKNIIDYKTALIETKTNEQKLFYQTLKSLQDN